MNRESWLNRLSVLLSGDFRNAGFILPVNIRISCGWPGGGRPSERVGECWGTHSSADGTFEIFISPTLSDPLQVGAVLSHELCHAAVGLEEGHKIKFKRCALAVGLTGQMTATEASPALLDRLAALAANLGPYPHAVLSLCDRKKQTTRLVKVVCPGCGYTVRTTRQWLEVGLPVCPCGETMEEGRGRLNGFT